VELWARGVLVTSVALDGDELTIGRAPNNDIQIDDPKASRHHAVVTRTGLAGWRVRDLTSSNGTFVNGRPVTGDRVLRHRDRIQIGDAELVYDEPGPRTETVGITALDGALAALPNLTPRERDVLVALCRPLCAPGSAFPVPASTREIGEELVVSDSAVRHHLDRLYDKFGVCDADPDVRRHHLATDAMRRGLAVPGAG
jgi:hypothetical protein